MPSPTGPKKRDYGLPRPLAPRFMRVTSDQLDAMIINIRVSLD